MAVNKRHQRTGISRSRPATEAIKRPPWVDDKSDFIPYPTNKVVGVIDDVKDAQSALRDLQKAGFSAG